MHNYIVLLVLLALHSTLTSFIHLPDISREDTAELFQVGDVEQGNLLINQFVEV